MDMHMNMYMYMYMYMYCTKATKAIGILGILGIIESQNIGFLEPWNLRILESKLATYANIL